MPKFISVPAPVCISDPISGKVTEKKVTFREFIVNSLMADPRWTRTIQDIEAAGEIMTNLRAETPFFPLERDTWDRFNAVASSPQGGYQGYHGSVLPQLLCFISAITKATDKAPDSAPVQA